MPASSPPAAARTSMMTSFSSLGSRGTSMRRSLSSSGGGVGLAIVGHALQLPGHARVDLRCGQFAGFGGVDVRRPGRRLEGRQPPASARRGAGRPPHSGCGRPAPPGRPEPPASAPAPGAPPAGGRGGWRPSGVLGCEGPGHDGTAPLHALPLRRVERGEQAGDRHLHLVVLRLAGSQGLQPQARDGQEAEPTRSAPIFRTS